MNGSALRRLRRRQNRKSSAEDGPITQQPEKLCRACCSSMPFAANKCIRCSSLQDWQRFITAIASLLGLAVASVSVLAFALPIWRDRFHVPRPRPHVALVGKELGAVLISVSNDGDAPMSVGDAWFQFEQRVAMLRNTANPRVIIKQNDIALLRFEPALQASMNNITDAMSAGTVAKPCFISVEIYEPSGNVVVPHASLDAGYDCDTAAFFLTTKEKEGKSVRD